MPPDAPSDRVRFQHMIDAAKEAMGFAAGRRREEFDSDRMLARAVINALQEIGEAAVRTSPAGRLHAPSLPWSNIVKMRNIMVHVYWGIDTDKVWSTVREDLPAMIPVLEQAIAQWHLPG